MSRPASSGEQAVAASVALDAPRTLRKSRRLTPGFLVSWLMSVMAIRAVVARVLAFRGREAHRRSIRVRRELLRRVARGLDAFLEAVPVEVTAHAPAHVERRVLVDAIHLLYLPVTRLAGDAGVDVTHVREVHVLGQLVNADPRDGFGVRSHARTDSRLISKLVELLDLGAGAGGSEIGGGSLRADEVVAPDACAHRRQ